MKAFRTGFGVFLAAAIAILPAAAAASLVPPGNSAVTQYTQALPTAGGPEQTGGDGHGTGRSPAKALGSRNARKLDAQGPRGRAAAAVAAATAPSVAISRKAAGRTQAAGRAGHSAGIGEPRPSSGSPRGSSGLGEAIGQATGSSSGKLGPLLPLLIVATVVWSLAFLRRRARKTAG